MKAKNPIDDVELLKVTRTGRDATNPRGSVGVKSDKKRGIKTLDKMKPNTYQLIPVALVDENKLTYSQMYTGITHEGFDFVVFLRDGEALYRLGYPAGRTPTEVTNQRFCTPDQALSFIKSYVPKENWYNKKK